jgi:hypothetical protein
MLSRVKSARALPAYLLCVGVIGAMLSPVLQRPPVDGFPLSTYPMFSHPRGPTAKIHTVLGITADGEAEVLSPRLIGGDPWSSLASRVTSEAARSRAKRRALCETVAARVAADPDRASRYVELEFVSEVYDVADYFVRGDTGAERRKLLARCPVPR